MSTAETSWSWAWPWWGTLVARNTIHMIVGIFLFIRSPKENNGVDAKYLRLMRTMGLIVVAVAFCRSIFVSSYLRQLAWFDSVLHSSILIRSFAIFAELSFAGLIAKSLLRMNEDVPEVVDTKNEVIAFLQTKPPIIFFVCILGVRVQDIVNSFRHEFYLVEGSRHRELDPAAEWSANSGLRRATVSAISYAQVLHKRQG